MRPLKTLQLVPVTIETAIFKIGDQIIMFPVKMESGFYLELKSQNDFKLYGYKGELPQKVIFKGKIPELQAGNNEISSTCDRTEWISSRLQVALIN